MCGDARLCAVCANAARAASSACVLTAHLWLWCGCLGCRATALVSCRLVVSAVFTTSIAARVQTTRLVPRVARRFPRRSSQTRPSRLWTFPVSRCAGRGGGGAGVTPPPPPPRVCAPPCVAQRVACMTATRGFVRVWCSVGGLSCVLLECVCRHVAASHDAQQFASHVFDVVYVRRCTGARI